jgi:hypothetical protein
MRRQLFLKMYFIISSLATNKHVGPVLQGTTITTDIVSYGEITYVGDA